MEFLHVLNGIFSLIYHFEGCAPDHVGKMWSVLRALTCIDTTICPANSCFSIAEGKKNLNMNKANQNADISAVTVEINSGAKTEKEDTVRTAGLYLSGSKGEINLGVDRSNSKTEITPVVVSETNLRITTGEGDAIRSAELYVSGPKGKMNLRDDKSKFKIDNAFVGVRERNCGVTTGNTVRATDYYFSGFKGKNNLHLINLTR